MNFMQTGDGQLMDSVAPLGSLGPLFVEMLRRQGKVPLDDGSSQSNSGSLLQPQAPVAQMPPLSLAMGAEQPTAPPAPLPTPPLQAAMEQPPAPIEPDAPQQQPQEPQDPQPQQPPEDMLPPLGSSLTAPQIDPYPQVKQHKGFLHRPGMSAALAALGSGLLGGKSFADGLSKGVMGFHQAMQDERDKRLPKLAADGAFAVSTDADGNQQFTETPIANYHREIEGAKFEQRKELAKDAAGYKAADRQEDRDWRSNESRLARDASAKQAEAQLAEAHAFHQAMFDVKMEQLKAAAGRVPQKAVENYTNAISKVRELDDNVSRLEPVINDIKSGALKIDALSNAHNYLAPQGLAPPRADTMQYGRYAQTVEWVRSNFLALQKGVQTNDDAKRALNLVVSSKGYGPAVAQNLGILLDYFRSQRNITAKTADIYNKQFHIEDDDSSYTPPPAGAGQGGQGAGVQPRSSGPAAPRTPRAPGQAYQVGDSATGPGGQKVYFNGYTWTPKKP